MADKVDVKNTFELVIMAGARAHQLLRGCTPKIEGPEKPARLAMLEVKQGKVGRVE
jgi:DNA-directed RNA polymerase subunit K/omega